MMKKLFALLLAAVMLLGAGATALAAEPEGAGYVISIANSSTTNSLTVDLLTWEGMKNGRLELTYPEELTLDRRFYFILTREVHQPAHFRRSSRLQYAASGVYGWSTTFIYKGETTMEFFNSAIEVLQTLVVALGAGLGVWGAINLLEGYGNDNPGSNAHVR